MPDPRWCSKVSSRSGLAEWGNPEGNGPLKSWGKAKGRSALGELRSKRPKGRSTRKMWLRCPFQGSTCAQGKWLQGSEKLLGYCYVQHLFNFFNLLLTVNKSCHSASICYSNNGKDRCLQNIYGCSQKKKSFSNEVFVLILKEVHVNWSKMKESRNNIPNPNIQSQPLLTFWHISFWLPSSIIFFPTQDSTSIILYPA